MCLDGRRRPVALEVPMILHIGGASTKPQDVVFLVIIISINRECEGIVHVRGPCVSFPENAAESAACTFSVRR